MPILLPGLCPLLTQNVVDKLGTQGINRVIDFICTEPAKITSLCEIPYKTVLSIRRVLLAQYSSFPVNGLNLYEESVSTLSILSTGCPELDELLCSGIFTGEVTEIRGSAATGKSQLCMCYAASIAESLSQNVIYIDCSCGFSPERTAQLVKVRLEETKHITETLSHIRVCNCDSTYHLLEILAVIRDSLNSTDDSFFLRLKTVIVDSTTAVLDPEIKKLSYVEGQSLLTMVKKELNSLAKNFTLAVVVTSELNTAEELKGWSASPLGYTWSTVASTQLDVRRPTGLEATNLPTDTANMIPRPVTITVRKSTHAQEDSEIKLKITEDGFVPFD